MEQPGSDGDDFACFITSIVTSETALSLCNNDNHHHHHHHHGGYYHRHC
jgi:hypothetical protein